MKITEQHRNVVVRYVFLTIGAISFALGTAGIVLPLLPTVPFYMLTLFCLARGSERDKALTLRAKLSILVSVSAIMAVGAYFSQDMPIALMVMGIIWVAHVIALAFIIKTKK